LATVSAAFLTKRALDRIKNHADVSVSNEQNINADVSSDQEKFSVPNRSEVQKTSTRRGELNA
jgi:hypothetical protein